MLVLVQGSDTFRRREALDLACDARLARADRETGLHRLEATTVSPADLEDAVASPGLFVSTTVVWCANWSAAKGDLAASLIDLAERGLPDEVTILVDFDADKKPDARLVAAADEQVDCSPFKRPDQASAWLGAFAARQGIAVAPDGARALVATVGVDAGTLAAELEKLRDFADGAPVSAAMVQELTADGIAPQPYPWYDAIGTRSLRTAGPALAKVRTNSEFPGVRLVLGLGAHLAAIAAARAHLDAGTRPNEIVQALGGWGGDKALAQAKHWTQPAIDSALRACLEADLALKRGRPDDATLIALTARCCTTPA